MEPVDEAQIWAPILANPLDWPPSTIPLPSQVEDYHFMEEPKPWRIQYLGDFVPRNNWSRGPRASRKRRIYTLGGQYRKDDKHWTQHEVIKLVKGVETYGAGRWTKIKRHYFSPPVGEPLQELVRKKEPVRTKDNLKDKWRNLLIACRVPPKSKKKAKAQKKMYLQLDSWIIKWIQGLATSRACKPKTTNPLGRQQLGVN